MGGRIGGQSRGARAGRSLEIVASVHDELYKWRPSEMTSVVSPIAYSGKVSDYIAIAAGWNIVAFGLQP